jgi:hypothetical protein
MIRKRKGHDLQLRLIDAEKDSEKSNKRQRSFTDPNIKVQEQRTSAKANMQQLVDTSGMHQCPEEGCTAVYHRRAYLDMHTLRGVHWYTGRAFDINYRTSKKATLTKPAWAAAGTPFTGDTTNDQLKRQAVVRVQEGNENSSLTTTSRTPAEAEHACIICDPALTLYDGSTVVRYELKTGYARRTNGVNSRFTLGQMEFVLFVQGLGDKTVTTSATCSKTVPRVAEEGMLRKGTAAGENLFPNQPYMRAHEHGQRAFRLEDLLDAQQIKAQMSIKRSELVRKYNTRKTDACEDPNAKRLRAKGVLKSHLL